MVVLGYIHALRRTNLKVFSVQTVLHDAESIGLEIVVVLLC